MNLNYPSASQVIRNVAELKLPFEVLSEDRLFRVVKFVPPFVSGSEFWVINEKGFLWEPVADLESGLAYLRCTEAQEYQAGIESA